MVYFTSDPVEVKKIKEMGVNSKTIKVSEVNGGIIVEGCSEYVFAVMDSI